MGSLALTVVGWLAAAVALVLGLALLWALGAFCRAFATGARDSYKEAQAGRRAGPGPALPEASAVATAPPAAVPTLDADYVAAFQRAFAMQRVCIDRIDGAVREVQGDGYAELMKLLRFSTDELERLLLRAGGVTPEQAAPPVPVPDPRGSRFVVH